MIPQDPGVFVIILILVAACTSMADIIAGCIIEYQDANRNKDRKS